MTTVPIDSSYYDDLQGLPLTQEQLRRVRHLISVIHTTHIVSDRISAMVRRHRLSEKKALQMIALHYFSHALQTAEAVYNLCIKGYGPAALILTRPLLETLINFSYLWLSKRIHGSDNERLAWIDYNDIERDKIYRMSVDEWRRREEYGLTDSEPIHAGVDPEEISTRAQAFKDKYGRSDWAIIKSLEDRAKVVDKTARLRELTGTTILLEGLYNQCYRWTSQIVHGTSGSTSLYTITEDEKVTITARPTAWIGESAGMAAHFLMFVTCLTDHLLHTNVDLNAQLDASGLRTEPTA